MAILVALSALSALAGAGAQAQLPYVNATVEGALRPGVYGRIDIGTAPPPPLLYVQPVIIHRTPVVVQQPPLYLHVPPGHAKKWSKHCSKYNACAQPVYFVKVGGDDDYEERTHKYREKDEHRGHGKGEGKGKGKSKHDD